MANPGQDIQRALIARNNVHLSGAGRQPMVFSHGFGCDQNMWRRVAPAFERDYRSRKLVASHGGELEVRSELGKGSEFWFTLRLAIGPEGSGARVEHPAAYLA